MSAALGDVVAAISSARPASGSCTTIVAIDGFGGAGKSTLAARVADRVEAAVVHTDDFASWENPLDWWPRLLDEVLGPLSRGETARYRRYDWHQRRFAGWHEVEPNGIVLLEGVSSSRREFRPYLSAAVWVQTARAVRLARGLERDGVEMRDMWLLWMASEDKWAAKDRPLEFANLIIQGVD